MTAAQRDGGPAAGDRVFLLDGREVEYVAVAGSLHLVAPIYETEYGDQTGDAFPVDRVFTQPPTEKLHAEVAELTEKVSELRQEQRGLQAELRENERITSERLKKLAKYRGLEQVEDFIEGRITHCVLTHQYLNRVTVLPIAEGLKGADGNRDRDMRLLCLFGRSNGDLAWRRNYYYDGSGGWDACEPYCSEEAAIARAKELLTERLADAPTNASQSAAIIESCERIGLSVPAEYRAMHHQFTREAAERSVARAQAELDKANAALLAARTEQPE